LSTKIRQLAKTVCYGGTLQTEGQKVTVGTHWVAGVFPKGGIAKAGSRQRASLSRLQAVVITYETTEVHDDPRLAASDARLVQAGGRVCIGSHGQFQGLGHHYCPVMGFEFSCNFQS